MAMDDYDESGATQDPLALLGVSGDDDDVSGDEIAGLDYDVSGDDDDVSGDDDFDVSGDDDDVSGDEIAGLDYVGADDEEVGAVARRLRRNPRQLKKFVAKAKNAKVRFSKLMKSRKAAAMKRARGRHSRQISSAALAGNIPQLALPVDSLAQAAAGIGAGVTVDIQPQPTRTLRITDFVCSPDTAASFRINRIEIAGVNLLAGGGAIDGSCFVPTVKRPPLKSVILAAGVPAVINVTNKSGAAATFNGIFYGIPVKAG